MVSSMMLGFRAWGSIVAFVGALACNLDTSGMGGGEMAKVDPTDPSTGESSMGTTDAPPDASSGAADTALDSTGEPPGTEDSTTASVDTADMDDMDDTEALPMEFERCNSQAVAIPDSDAAGVFSMINIPVSGTILELRVVVRASHEYVGDLEIELTKDGPSVLLIDNAGNGGTLCSGNDIDVVLHDEAGISVDDACMYDGGDTPALVGDVRPEAPLGSAFGGTDMLGNWRLHVIDRLSPDMGMLTEWCLQITYE
jgi:hypothetical protein